MSLELIYPGKKSADEILQSTPKAQLERVFGDADVSNWLVQGDNLLVMKSLMEDFDLHGKVDLVYIDPPFATKTIFRVGDDRAATISASQHDRVAYTDMLSGEAYLEFVRQRLIFIRELMSDSASIYLHIDYKVGHYVKIIMDELFGEKNFRNDIARIKCNPKNFRRKGYGNIKDLILFYSKTDAYYWREPDVERPETDILRLFPKVDTQGRHYTTNPLHAPGETRNGNTGKPWRGVLPPKGRHWRYEPAVLETLDQSGLIAWSANGVPRKIIYADAYAKKRLQDIWEFKDRQTLSYPTEKNPEMLKLIVETSSPPGGMVLDCFCGSGGTLLAAAEQHRRWVGVDQSFEAIDVARKRLASAFPYAFYQQQKVNGEPFF